MRRDRGSFAFHDARSASASRSNEARGVVFRASSECDLASGISVASFALRVSIA
jgi:hypothetical protein